MLSNNVNINMVPPAAQWVLSFGICDKKRWSVSENSNCFCQWPVVSCKRRGVVQKQQPSHHDQRGGDPWLGGSPWVLRQVWAQGNSGKVCLWSLKLVYSRGSQLGGQGPHKGLQAKSEEDVCVLDNVYFSGTLKWFLWICHNQHLHFEVIVWHFENCA